MLKDMEMNLSQLMNSFVSQLQSVQIPAEYKVFFDHQKSKKSRRKNPNSNGSLPQKVYTLRNSLLTDLFEITHIQTIYHIFIAILIILFMSTTLEELVETGTINLDFQLMQWALGNFEAVVMTWVN